MIRNLFKFYNDMTVIDFFRVVNIHVLLSIGFCLGILIFSIFPNKLPTGNAIGLLLVGILLLVFQLITIYSLLKEKWWGKLLSILTPSCFLILNGYNRIMIAIFLVIAVQILMNHFLGYPSLIYNKKKIKLKLGERQ